MKVKVKCPCAQLPHRHEAVWWQWAITFGPPARLVGPRCRSGRSGKNRTFTCPWQESNTDCTIRISSLCRLKYPGLLLRWFPNSALYNRFSLQSLVSHMSWAVGTFVENNSSKWHWSLKGRFFPKGEWMGEILVLNLTYGDRRMLEEREQRNGGPLKGFLLIHFRMFADPTASSTRKMKLLGSCESLAAVTSLHSQGISNTWLRCLC
jgi:hypothetical protein